MKLMVLLRPSGIVAGILLEGNSWGSRQAGDQGGMGTVIEKSW